LSGNSNSYFSSHKKLPWEQTIPLLYINFLLQTIRVFGWGMFWPMFHSNFAIDSAENGMIGSEDGRPQRGGQ
jgi:hypothetical protein